MSHSKKRVITFFITNKCNLNCSYCVNDTGSIHSSKNLDLAFAKKALDDFFEERIDIFGIGNFGIRFYAIGEPTQNIDLIKQLTNYARLLRPNNLYVELQSNGVFGKQARDWIKDNVSELWLSVDGAPAVQNVNRPTKGGFPTARIIENNILYLQQQGVFVGVRSTITRDNVSKQIDLLKYFKSLNINWVYAEPVFEPVKQNDQNIVKKITNVDLDLFREEFLKAYFFAEKQNMHYGNFFTMNFDEPCTVGCRSGLPMPHVTIDGYISGCDLAYVGTTKLKDFIFGKYNKAQNKITYFPDKIKNIRKRNIFEMTECSTCDVKYNCAGGCAGLAYHATGSMFGVVPEVCKTVKFLAKRLPKNNGCALHLHP